MILLLGGTIDSRKIASLLSQDKINFIASTVSQYGKELASQNASQVISQAMDEEALIEFIKEKKIKIILDASHPFAKNVSINTIRAAQAQGIRYVRFERPEERSNSDIVFYVKSLEEAAEAALEIGNNILLTIGSRGLMTFKEVAEKKNLFARVLPELESIRACKDAGIGPGKIIAMQGPFSDDFNKLLIKEKNIDLLISKSSGKEGGLDEKIAAAEESGCKLVIIERPTIDYPLVFDDINKIIDFIKEEI